MNLPCQREAFEIPRDVVYLNAAYLGPLSRAVIAAGREGLERKRHPWTITPDDFFEPVDQARSLFAQVIDADSDGVAVLPSVSYGVAIAAQNLPFPSGSRVVVLDEEFPSNVYAWRDLAERNSGNVVTVPRPSDDDWTTAVLEAIDDRTAIASLSHYHWTDGGFVDLERVGERLREVGAALVVDGTQSVGAMPFDVERIRPDFLVAAVYKWMLGPYSAAFLWCAEEHRSGRPLEYSWLTRRGSGDFPHLVDYQSAYRPGARRYDVGETPNFALMPAITAALKQTLEWGVEEICEYVSGLNAIIESAAPALGLGMAPEGLRARHLLGLRLRGQDPELVAKAMADANVHVSVRGEAVRVSPHVYNDETDVNRFVEVLRATL